MITPSKERMQGQVGSADLGRRVRPEGRDVISYGRWDPFARMRDEFDRLFDQYFKAVPTAWDTGGRERSWGLDVRETEDSVVIEAEAPGFEPEDFDIEIRDDRLILSATRKAELEDKGYRTWRQQELYRQVLLPSTVEPDKVEAKYRNGLLTVLLPRSERAKTRRVKVGQ